MLQRRNRNYPHAGIVFKHLALYVLRLLPSTVGFPVAGAFPTTKGPQIKELFHIYSHSHQLRVVVNTVDGRSPARPGMYKTL